MEANATVQVPLRGGLIALIDASDAATVLQHKWHAHQGGGKRYVGSMIRIGDKQTAILLHRLILGLTTGDGRLGDHINGDGLDNRRANLRVATPAQNAWNMRAARSRSGFKGVHFRRGKYIAICNKDRVGIFSTAEEAARAYDLAAVAKWGEFAATNKSLGLIP